ncbi:protein mono-ADP-ribosyltransferase PARP12-like isoform X2 [Carcharodon carcharias]|uniref:protein mono-ADP-ribosyltransferase PARP12-like isoform X2 n=1 Tax=Carcharodon carcharias TaxID=13397 RepID=UPI001B7F18FF|nr:protein mono-ADP-ribosyltransferase PARP12-like isoform X2 [Carcharodon carcharias]
MALDRIRDYGLKELCSHGGSLEYSSFRRKICQYFQISGRELCRLLRRNDQCFAILPGKGSSTSPELPEDSQLIASTSLRLCKDFLKKDCDGSCGQLHLCKFFLLGNCKFSKGRTTCNFSHTVHSSHNVPVLIANKLRMLSELELCQLLLQNDPSLLPEICTFYNKGPGHYGGCTRGQACTKLHICLHFAQGSCKFGPNCKRCHSFRDNNSSVTLENLSPEVTQRLQQIYQNVYSLKNYKSSDGKEKTPRSRQSSGSTSGDVDSEEICLYFVRKNCSFKDKCIRIHSRLPYQWQVYEETWKDILNTEQIEKDYCDPNKTRSLQVDFNAMVKDFSQVRRLSTASSVTKPPHYILTTEWLWYWKDEFGKWIEFGKQEGQHSAASTTSVDLEKAYLADSNGQVEFTAGRYQYVLNFKEMSQRNTRLGTQRDVRRRPKFVSEQDVENQIQNQGKPGQEQSGTTQGKCIPAHWDKSVPADMEYKLVLLPESSEEYKQVQALFQRTMRNNVIRKIERIQNQALWEVFQWQKEQMKKVSNGTDVAERQLFHGTDPQYIEAICQQNFDWRICGVHGTTYGKGSYFARDASYSHNYCRRGQTTMTMFVARVLVGQFVKGSSSYLRPPLRDGSRVSYYDSCVNDVSNPSIFVIFEKHQIYPEYVIEYNS